MVEITTTKTAANASASAGAGAGAGPGPAASAVATWVVTVSGEEPDSRIQLLEQQPQELSARL